MEPVFGSVGRPFPGVEVRLLDESGADVFVGDAGEVFVRGPMVSPGYFNDPEATKRTRTEDGWLITGDLAVVDDDGNLAIIDRLKDLIIVSGFNVHPAEIERVLLSHDAIDAAAVIGEADPKTGERPVAHVVLRDGGLLTETEVIDHCRSRLARYKAPGRVVFTTAIPTGLGGKIRRSALAELGD
jgi:acyl-CoA synthetase (AMP-forming)/AMP-acid ligase II